MTEPRVPWVVGVSGASGTPYARAVLNGLLDAGHPVDLVVSRAARLTILDETGLSFRDSHWRDDLATWLTREPGDVRYWSAGDLGAGPASGSYRTRGMVVVPASTAAVAGIAIGLSKDLLQRAADVNIKERRPFVIVPRETPYTRATLAAPADAARRRRGRAAGESRLLQRAAVGGPAGRFRGRQGARRARRRARSDHPVDG